VKDLLSNSVLEASHSRQLMNNIWEGIACLASDMSELLEYGIGARG
jgi:hypothetical protein